MTSQSKFGRHSWEPLPRTSRHLPDYGVLVFSKVAQLPPFSYFIQEFKLLQLPDMIDTLPYFAMPIVGIRRN